MTSSSTVSSSRDRQVAEAGVITRLDRFTLVGLFILGLVSRLPFTGQVLYHWDSINFAYALHEFDVAAGQPHVPGYILYVFLGKIVSLIVQNDQSTLLSISVVSSGLAVAFLYLLGRDIFNRWIGFWAALFLASSPLFWFYGEIALPHSLDAFIVILLAWLLYRVLNGERKYLLPAAICLGIAGGFRPQTEVFLAPLALFAVWQGGFRHNWRPVLIALAALIAVNLAWFIPLIVLSGGLGRYFEIMGAFTADFNTTTSIFSGGLWGLTRNVRKLVIYTLYGWALGLIPIGLAGLNWLLSLVISDLKRAPLSRMGMLRSLISDRRTWFFSLWIAPTLIYYTLIHMGQQGLVFVFLPALLLLSGAAAFSLFENWPQVSSAVSLLMVAGNAAIFLFAPTYPLGGESPKLLTTATLREHDSYYMERFESIASHFNPENTLLLSSSWRFPQYYLPDYSLLHYELGARWEVSEGQPLRDEEVTLAPDDLGLVANQDGGYTLVLFEESLANFDRTERSLQWLVLPEGGKLLYYWMSSLDRIYLGSDYFQVAPVEEGAGQ